jgi:uncharacterized protein (TIGR03086 family)
VASRANGLAILCAMPISEASRENLLASVALFDSRVDAVSDDEWSAPSPCEGWTARDVVAHCATNLRALRDSVTGGDFFTTFGNPIEGDVASAWRDANQTVKATLEDIGVSDTATVGGNAVPLIAVVDGLMRDFVIHSWDLARAVGGDESLPDDLVASATDAMAMVGDDQRVPGLYGKKVDVPTTASPQDQLIALSGRRP